MITSKDGFKIVLEHELHELHDRITVKGLTPGHWSDRFFCAYMPPLAYLDGERFFIAMDNMEAVLNAEEPWKYKLATWHDVFEVWMEEQEA